MMLKSQLLSMAFCECKSLHSHQFSEIVVILLRLISTGTSSRQLTVIFPKNESVSKLVLQLPGARTWSLLSVVACGVATYNANPPAGIMLTYVDMFFFSGFLYSFNDLE